MKQLIQDLQSYQDKEKACALARFFKTQKGEYGEGDKFLGVSVPQQRKIAKKYQTLSLHEVEKSLHSLFHECRLTALFVLILKYRKSEKQDKDHIVKIYLRNTKYVNNWDLVDSSAHSILGDWLLDKNRKILYKLAKAKNLWERRIAIVSTFAFIRNNEFEDTIRISTILLDDKHDLIHKAVGWMLREVGNRDQAVEEEFLKKYYTRMPRTMLRYAVEKFSESKRRRYLVKEKKRDK